MKRGVFSSSAEGGFESTTCIYNIHKTLSTGGGGGDLFWRIDINKAWETREMIFLLKITSPLPMNLSHVESVCGCAAHTYPGRERFHAYN